MSWSQQGRAKKTSLSARLAVPFVAAVAAAILAVPRPAAAHVVICNEIFNPHGQTTPPAGSTTLPGPKGGQNEDGFYQVGACSVPPGTPVCPTGLGGPEFAGLCTCDGGEEAVTLRDGCPGETGGGTGTIYSVNGDTTFDFGTILKYTEANGKPADIKPMAGNNSPNGGGEAVSVDWHIWGQGDLWVCSAVDPASCICCHVPPPPK